MLTCKRLRTAVFLSALLLVAGLILESLVSAIPALAWFSYMALFLVLGGSLVLGLTFLASLLPGTAKRLAECQH